MERKYIQKYIMNRKRDLEMNIKTYAAYYDNDVRQQSSSGGIFSLLASKFDIVYGVAMTADNYSAEFVRAESDISALRGSKYLQANVGNTYINVKNDLKSGKTVLFSGTGCQVNGLKKFLGKVYDNLFCVDVICHGVPSPSLWEMYVKHQEQVNGNKVESVNFRCKKKGWKDFGMKENTVFVSKDVDPYMQMFLRDYCLRPSCYECKAKENKLSDMTIADFWGIENVAPEMNDNQGVSLIIVRNEKAIAMFDDMRSDLQCKEVSYEDGVRQNPSEYSSVKKPQERDAFFEDMHSMSFVELSQKYAKPRQMPLIIKLKRRIKSILVNAKKWGDYGIQFIFCVDEKESR